MSNARGLPVLAGVWVGACASIAMAEPIGPTVLCEQYPLAPECASGPSSCTLCHDDTDAENPTWNAYGLDIRDALAGGDFEMWIADAIAEVDALDSDGDGFANGDEIREGSHPGDAASVPFEATCPDDVSDLPYRLCEYDPPFAYRRVMLDFCGHSPTYEQLEEFRALEYEEQLEGIDEQLDECLRSEHWRGERGVLWEQAYDKVRPVQALKAGRGPSEIENLRIADYNNDIMLWVWSQIDGNDVRNVLLADFFVLQRGTEFEVVPDIGGSSMAACGDDLDCPWNETCLEDVCQCPGGCDEAVQTDRRRGLLTTRWTLLYGTMFTPIPRATAAQAYRAFLGFDIAKLEGLSPVEGEPLDYDAKGVDAPQCAVCHTTLDPLSYPFTTYTGFGPGGRAIYVPNRMSMSAIADQAPNIADTPEAGVILGQPVEDLRQWAEVAADSPQFAQAVVDDYWDRLVDQPPNAAQAEEFSQLWNDLMTTHDYSVEAMLHDLVRTEAYGAP